MKKKFFLFVSLVLLAVQGWATLVDSQGRSHSFNQSDLHPGEINQDVKKAYSNIQNVIEDVSVPVDWFIITTDFRINLDDFVFPVLTVGETITKSFEVKGHNTTIFDEIPVLLTDENGVYSVNPPKIYGTSIDLDFGGQAKKVEVTYTPTTAGRHKARITLRSPKKVLYVDEYTIHYDYFERWVDFEAVAVNPPDPAINVSNSFLNFGQTPKDTEVPQTITVWGTRLTGNLTLSSDNPFFTVSPSRITATEAQDGKPVTVTFKPTAAGTHTGTLTISGVGVDGVPVSTPVSLSGQCDLPALTCDVSAINFGSFALGDDDTKTIIINGSNLTEDLTITSNNSNFTVDPTTISRYSVIPVGASYGNSVAVTYKPTAPGTHSGIITISGSGVNAEVNVSGQCVGNPTISVTPSTYDFGTVKEGTDTLATFTVTGTNLSDRISIVSALEEGFTISPSVDVGLSSAGGKVTVTFKPTSGGDYSRVFTFSSGDAIAKLTVTGKCSAATTNKSALYFGSARKGETKTQKFKVTGVNLTHDLTLTSSNSSVFVVSPSTITAAQAKAGKEVTVIYKPNAYVDHSGTITISGQDIKSKSVSLSGKCANITVSPASYDFGTCTKGKAYTKTFTVTGTNVGERISVVTQYEEEFSVTPSNLPAAGGTVTVTFKPSSTGSSYSFTFYVSGGGITTPVSVTGKSGTPSISVNPSSLHFTTASSQTITVTGYYLTGNITLKSNQAPFTVSPTTLPPSGGTVTVTCNANNFLNSATGSITIKSDGATTRTVPLTYTAGPGPLEIYSIKPDDEQENIINGGELEISTIGLGGICSNMDELSMNSKVYAEGLNIIIESPVEQRAVISDIAGHVREVNLQVGRNEFPVNASGVYLVRIREKSTKLMLK